MFWKSIFIIVIYNYKSINWIWHTTSLVKVIIIKILPQYPSGDDLTHRGKLQILKNFPGSDLAVNFSPEQIAKPTGDNMRILRGEPHKHTFLNKKHTHISSPYIHICVYIYIYIYIYYILCIYYILYYINIIYNIDR